MLKDALINRGLSNREVEVTELVSTGLSNKEVAKRLFVTEKTVKFHLTNIYKKMSIKSRAQLIVWCLPHMGFVEREEPTTETRTPTDSRRPMSLDTKPTTQQDTRTQTTIEPDAQLISGFNNDREL